MSSLFSINFRREAYLREVARARRRVVALGAWVAYFGLFAIVLGLYGLNCVSLTRRAGQVERQAARLRGAQESGAGWTFSQSELSQMERYAMNPRQWRDRLTRVAALMPENARVSSIEYNAGNLPTTAPAKLVITGTFKSEKNQDQMQGVMGIVQSLHADSVFSRSYRNIKLASTRAIDGSGQIAEFEIECQ